MKKIYLSLVSRIASGLTLAVLGVLWLLVEFLVRPEAELEISRWSKGEASLDLALLLDPQTVTGQIARYTTAGKRIYSFVVLTLEMASAVLFFLLFSTLFFLFAVYLPSWWKKQWWKIPPLVLFLDLMANSLLLYLLASSPQLDDLLVWCFVALNTINQLARGLVYLLAAFLTFQEAKQWLKARSKKLNDL